VTENNENRSGASILNPPLPYAMKERVERAARDVQLQQFVNSAADGKNTKRLASFHDVFGDRYAEVRKLAGRIKQHTLDHLDYYLDTFVDRAEENGIRVHFASDARQANQLCLSIANSRSCKLCVKSKSMVTEECGLVPELKAAGISTIETDLGEFIVQLDDDAPAHIVTPMIHKDRKQVARAFVRELGAEYEEDPQRLTKIARKYMREQFRQADLGISGANFLIAETGSMVLCTNEGNGCFSTSVPPVHIAVVGIEKVIPKAEYLGLFLKLLARSSTAQPITVYTTIISGPRRERETDGPEEMHLILVDNGRTELLREETREMLRCIRCGACLNACPVYRKVGGGHAYGAVYSGPIGAVITPLFKGISNYPDLPQASSLCGACHEACPVDIDIPRHLIRLRRELVSAHQIGFFERNVYKLWAKSLSNPLLYRGSQVLGRWGARMIGQTRNGPREPMQNVKWIRNAPGPLKGWTIHRDLPTPTSERFRDWWKRNRGGQS